MGQLMLTSLRQTTGQTTDPTAQTCNSTLSRTPTLALVHILVDRLPPFLVPLMYLRCSTFLLANFIQSTALRNAVIMALPHDVGIGRKREEALDCLSVTC